MIKKGTARCKYETALERWEEQYKTFEEEQSNMAAQAEKTIRDLIESCEECAHINDNDVVVTIYGDYSEDFYVKNIEIEEDKTVVIVLDNNDMIEFWDLSFAEMASICAAVCEKFCELNDIKRTYEDVIK